MFAVHRAVGRARNVLLVDGDLLLVIVGESVGVGDSRGEVAIGRGRLELGILLLLAPVKVPADEENGGREDGAGDRGAVSLRPPRSLRRTVGDERNPGEEGPTMSRRLIKRQLQQLACGEQRKGRTRR